MKNKVFLAPLFLFPIFLMLAAIKNPRWPSKPIIVQALAKIDDPLRITNRDSIINRNDDD